MVVSLFIKEVIGLKGFKIPEQNLQNSVLYFLDFFSSHLHVFFLSIGLKGQQLVQPVEEIQKRR